MYTYLILIDWVLTLQSLIHLLSKPVTSHAVFVLTHAFFGSINCLVDKVLKIGCQSVWKYKTCNGMTLMHLQGDPKCTHFLFDNNFYIFKIKIIFAEYKCMNDYQLFSAIGISSAIYIKRAWLIQRVSVLERETYNTTKNKDVYLAHPVCVVILFWVRK